MASLCGIFHVCFHELHQLWHTSLKTWSMGLSFHSWLHEFVGIFQLAQLCLQLVYLYCCQQHTAFGINQIHGRNPLDVIALCHLRFLHLLQLAKHTPGDRLLVHKFLQHVRIGIKRNADKLHALFIILLKQLLHLRQALTTVATPCCEEVEHHATSMEISY